jgi:hypothetical protein
MRRGPVIVLALIGALLLGATVVYYSKYRKSLADYTQATAEQENMRARYDQAVGEIVTIQDSLNAIVLGDLPNTRDVEVQQPGTLHDRVLDRVATLKAAIERTRDRIEELDVRLKKSGVKIAGMERMMSGLRREVNEKESRIAMLTTQVDTLQTRVTGLTADVETKQQELAQRQEELLERQRELATIFYTVGTKKELTKAGVVEGKGGVLGVGKTLKLSGSLNEATFTPLNTDQENTIRIPSEKAQVLSAQPASSYTLQPISKEMVELHIVNPTEFRKVKHLVILKS